MFFATVPSQGNLRGIIDVMGKVRLPGDRVPVDSCRKEDGVAFRIKANTCAVAGCGHVVAANRKSRSIGFDARGKHCEVVNVLGVYNGETFPLVGRYGVSRGVSFLFDLPLLTVKDKGIGRFEVPRVHDGRVGIVPQFFPRELPLSRPAKAQSVPVLAPGSYILMCMALVLSKVYWTSSSVFTKTRGFRVRFRGARCRFARGPVRPRPIGSGGRTGGIRSRWSSLCP